MLREEYGDWQTSYSFSTKVCQLLKNLGVSPEVILEPTCGVGNFIKAALDVFHSVRTVYAVEISSDYCYKTERLLNSYLLRGDIVEYHVYNISVFDFDFCEIVDKVKDKRVLVLGNPPWVTNTSISKINGVNLPKKSNFNKLRGIDAITGGGNFDISENICYKILKAFAHHENVILALLLKNSVIKRIVFRLCNTPSFLKCVRSLQFDAQKEFGVSVSASLLVCKLGDNDVRACQTFDFYTGKFLCTFGWVGDRFVSNVRGYEETKFLDGVSPLMWRSGVKHDCSKVMELSPTDSGYVNGFNVRADVDSSNVFPLIKSSDIVKGLTHVRKFVILPQLKISDDTSSLMVSAPKTYEYLLSYGPLLDNRKSLIYKGRSRFCVFGLGDYSFLPYKVIVSSLYSRPIFSLIGPVNGKPVMVDDTCYLLGFDNLEYAKLTLFLLRSELLKRFLSSICFIDSKRVINKETLMRIDLCELVNAVDLSGVDINPSVIEEYKLWLLGKSNI